MPNALESLGFLNVPVHTDMTWIARTGRGSIRAPRCTPPKIRVSQEPSLTVVSIIQIDYSQRFSMGGINFNCRYRIALPIE